MSRAPGHSDDPDMKKRVLASALWFYAAWYGGAMIAHLFGVSTALGPILGIAAGAICAIDPRQLLWTRPATPNVAPVVGMQAHNPA